MSDSRIPTRVLGRQGLIVSALVCWLLGSSVQKVSCAGYLGHPFGENDGFCERISQVASTLPFNQIGNDFIYLPRHVHEE